MSLLTSAGQARVRERGARFGAWWDRQHPAARMFLGVTGLMVGGGLQAGLLVWAAVAVSYPSFNLAAGILLLLALALPFGTAAGAVVWAEHRADAREKGR